MSQSSTTPRHPPLDSLATRVILVVFLGTFLTAAVVTSISVQSTFAFLREQLDEDLPAVARPVLDQSQRREIMAAILQKLDSDYELEKWVAESPLVEVDFPAG